MAGLELEQRKVMLMRKRITPQKKPVTKTVLNRTQKTQIGQLYRTLFGKRVPKELLFQLETKVHNAGTANKLIVISSKKGSGSLVCQLRGGIITNIQIRPNPK